MKTIEDVLTAEELSRYKENWAAFKDKYAPNTPYHVHSGMPVISKVFHFEDKPVFRAHVFSKKMRRFDPYHAADKCIQPFWHAQHYLMVAEQLYTASSKMVIGKKYERMMAKDVPAEFNWKKPLFWDDNVSVELIREELGKVGPYEKQIGSFTFYSDKADRVLSRMSAESYWVPRAYVIDIEKLKSGDMSAASRLIRKIEMQAINHQRLRVKRKIGIDKESLIREIAQGNVPEEIHDFFSLWDTP
jgi:hypothetical protein